MLQLHKYQKRAISEIALKKTVFLMADVGMGKTAIALHAIKNSRRPALVMAPLQPCYTTWPDEIRKWMPEFNYTVLHGPHKDQKVTLKRKVTILPYSSLKWYVGKIRRKEIPLRQMFLVLDESSMVKSPSTQRFQMLKNMFALFPEWRICLSATPATNSLLDLWSQTFMLDQGKRLCKSYYRFRDSYFVYTGPPQYKTFVREGSEKTIYDRIAPISFRLDEKDHLTLPPVMYRAIKVKLAPSTRKTYQELENKFCANVLGGKVNAVNAAALSSKLRQVVQGAVYGEGGKAIPLHMGKVNRLKELLDSAAGNPILCPIQFRFEADLIRSKCGKKVPIIAGGVPIHTRKYLAQEWNKGRLPLLLCHPQSLGHGSNLQFGGHTIVWFGMTWSLEHYIQLNGRLARQGQRKSVVINHLIAEDTIDERVFSVLKQKNVTQRDLLNAVKSYALEKQNG